MFESYFLVGAFLYGFSAIILYALYVLVASHIKESIYSNREQKRNNLRKMDTEKGIVWRVFGYKIELRARKVRTMTMSLSKGSDGIYLFRKEGEWNIWYNYKGFEIHERLDIPKDDFPEIKKIIDGELYKVVKNT
jgi:hypothetical protein